jgi:hypothetical protein
VSHDVQPGPKGSIKVIVTGANNYPQYGNCSNTVFIDWCPPRDCNTTTPHFDLSNEGLQAIAPSTGPTVVSFMRVSCDVVGNLMMRTHDWNEFGFVCLICLFHECMRDLHNILTSLSDYSDQFFVFSLSISGGRWSLLATHLLAWQTQSSIERPHKQRGHSCRRIPTGLWFVFVFVKVKTDVVIIWGFCWLNLLTPIYTHIQWWCCRIFHAQSSTNVQLSTAHQHHIHCGRDHYYNSPRAWQSCVAHALHTDAWQAVHCSTRQLVHTPCAAWM